MDGLAIFPSLDRGYTGYTCMRKACLFCSWLFHVASALKSPQAETLGKGGHGPPLFQF